MSPMDDNVIVPRPDPTTLTTAQLKESITAVREVFDARLSGMDRAIELLASTQSRTPSETERGLLNLKDLHGERFDSFDKQLVDTQRGIALQFAERDVRLEQAAVATKIAVDAALQAQKEAANATNVSNTAAIAKSELNTTKLIDGIVALLNSTVKATDEKIGDLKGRLDRGEGNSSGIQYNVNERRSNTNTMVAWGTLAVASITGVVGLLGYIALHIH
jgi:hypothetical protein